jgi:hypothetical protein
MNYDRGLDGQRLHLLGQGQLLGGRHERPGEPDGQPVGVRGHFAALETPGLLVQDIRTFFTSLAAQNTP